MNDAGRTPVVLALDHLVIAARTLADGVAWCEATFGVAPDGGGVHAWMGTHNRLLAIASARHPRAYLEIIAIDPAAPPPARTRWFDLDDAALRATLDGGPRLIHWVARATAPEAAAAALRHAALDPGPWHAVERATPTGLLRWRLTVRDDGRRLARGALPTLIDWSGAHPADMLPARGIELATLELAGLPAACAAWLPAGIIDAAEGGAPLRATFTTPRGPLVLDAAA